MKKSAVQIQLNAFITTPMMALPGPWVLVVMPIKPMMNPTIPASPAAPPWRNCES